MFLIFRTTLLFESFLAQYYTSRLDLYISFFFFLSYFYIYYNIIP